MADTSELLKRITTDPAIFASKPIICGRRLGYPWLKMEDIEACRLHGQHAE